MSAPRYHHNTSLGFACVLVFIAMANLGCDPRPSSPHNTFIASLTHLSGIAVGRVASMSDVRQPRFFASSPLPAVLE